MLDFSSIQITIAILWLFVSLIDYFDYAYLWQLKWYRFDRIKELYQAQGLKAFSRYNILWRGIGFLLLIFWPVNQYYIVEYIIFLILVLDIVYAIYKYFEKILRRPIFSIKATLLILTSTIFEAGALLYMRDYLLLLFLMLFRFFIISIFVLLANLLTDKIRNLKMHKAEKKLKSYKNLKIIGITGSYGKTSVKEFLYHILSKKFKVIKTPKNINTEIGIANFILKNNFDDYEVFVVEMGAYRIGEIEKMCEMVHPQIGVLTAIANQHVSLFGSIRNTQKAKYELIRSIPKDGLVVTNADNDYCTEFLNELDCQNIQTYGVESEKNPDCYATEIKSKLDGFFCKGYLHGEYGEVHAPIIGAHHAYNIGAATLVANYLGMSGEEIAKHCLTIPTDIHGSIKLYKYGKASIIDDSYNSNPRGFCAALDVLNLYPQEKRRIVITRGMLELGERSDAEHEKIAGEISFIADELVVITKDFIEPLKNGVVEKYNLDILVKDQPNTLLTYLKSLKDENVVILLENRMPSLITEELQKNKK